MKSNEPLINIEVKGKEEKLFKFFNPINQEDYYISMDEIERAIAVRDEYYCPAHPVRTIVSLKNGYWFCVETEKVYQLTEVKEM